MATKKTTAVDTPNLEETTAIDGPEVKYAPVNPVVTLDLADAEKLYELYRNVELADVHFHTCQSGNFRQHVQGVYRAANVKNAYDKLKAAIDATKGE